MRFVLVDQLLALDPPSRIVAAKNVSMAEEYLADHFPGFPVLPGVLMLEAAVQTAAWLVRHATDFQKSLVVLREARGVRYGTFVPPGKTLVIHAEAVELSSAKSEFKIRGLLDGATAVQARLSLAHLNLADEDAALAGHDAALVAGLRDQWNVLRARAAATDVSL